MTSSVPVMCTRAVRRGAVCATRSERHALFQASSSLVSCCVGAWECVGWWGGGGARQGWGARGHGGGRRPCARARARKIYRVCMASK